MKLERWITAFFRKKKLDAEMAEEMREHLKRRAEANLGTGMSAEEARYAAQRQFGGVEQLKEIAREQRGWFWFEQLMRDGRYSARALRKAPGFVASVVLTLSLGVGLVTAIVNVAQPILLPDLPFPEPERLVFLRERSPQMGDGYTTPTLPRFAAYAERSTSFAAWGAERGDVVNLIIGDEPQVVRVSLVTKGLFPALRARSVQGRLWAAEEFAPAQAGESVVLSHAAWTRYFGQAPDLIGREIQLGGRSRRVIGILAPEFRTEQIFDRKDGIYLAAPEGVVPNGGFALNVIGRLKPGVTLTQAEAELNSVRPEAPAGNTFLANARPVLISLADAFREQRATPFRVLLGAAAALLLIGCTAVANLMLSRSVVRRRELGVRLALGGSRRRIMALILTEAVLLAGLCGAGSALVAVWSQRLLTVLAPAGIDAGQLLQHAVFGRTFGFAVALAAVTCLSSAAIPAWRAGRLGLNETLKEGGGAVGDSRRLSFLRGLLVVAQCALAVTLLTGAGLLIKTVHRLASIELGFVPQNKWVVSGSRRAAGTAAPARPAAVANAEIAARLAALPGVAAVAPTSSVPGGGGGMVFGSIAIDGVSGRTEVNCYQFQVGGDYFETIGTPLVAGRSFAQFRPGDRPVAILSEGLARRCFPNENPVGRMLTLGKSVCEIVGVAREVVMSAPSTVITDGGSGNRASGQVYLPTWQTASPLPGFSAILRLSQPPGAEFAATVRRIVFELDPSLVVNLQALDDVVGGWSRQQRQTLLILQMLSALALALAAFGVFSVMAYAVVQRRRELGLRLVLGATPGGIMALVMRRGLRLAGIGAVAGLALAAALSRFLGALLFQTPAHDPLVYLEVGGVLFVAAALACGWPALRAARIDPVAALRAE